ncbi:hypothetical protein SAMD00019534_076760 [Acytostelium subglobosum LB1]|uniref:hypothetical protein n=1 Tax=Acytostelium subglobosum LB1 TaxID=1410327 RepID=UPI000644D10B|nr:hypothetical protein SAMD00019534_076760 [Acytostelium subglobosum LB1]GAM24501.1 hypothetical protein SAMD00019534_076760 [Acytostelium subglobosum LB1]|eukprot:XP_012752827.1 hypothetical protein SAMD00019534_076760 [Acytostelium subglobosum LB1]
MKLSILIVSVLFITVNIVAGYRIGQSVDYTGWDLYFADEFSGTSLNTSVWRAENLAWPYSGQLEYYSPANCRVTGGNLEMTAKKEIVGGRNYTSCRISTDTKMFNLTYGRFEARMKLPVGKGFWPSFYMFDKRSEKCNATNPSEYWEIDVIENVGFNDNDNIHGSWWYGPATCQDADQKIVTRTSTISNIDSAFHIYSVVWDVDFLMIMVDNIPYLIANKTANIPFPNNVPMYMILDLAIGGAWPGSPDATTIFPSKMIVDYVRIYKKNPNVPVPTPTPQPSRAPLPTYVYGQTVDYTGWKLTFNEDFNGTSINKSIWTVENLAWPYGGELSYYQPANCRVTGGNLVIDTKSQTVGDRAYTSCRITTRNKLNNLNYGRFEARMKLPSGKGLVPLFQLFGIEGYQDCLQPYYEFTVMQNQPATNNIDSHWYMGSDCNAVHGGEGANTVNNVGGYHLYSMVWDYNFVMFMVDNVPYLISNNNPGWTFPNDAPSFMVLQTSVGGRAGAPDATTILPASTYVDWVRIYQRV